MSTTDAQLYEVFPSIQGEGLYVGERQIFVRFLMCNMSCAYCDSQDSLAPQKTFRVEETPGKRDFKSYNNPATLDQLYGIIDQLNRPKHLHHSISLTGGEPLLQVDFLKSLIPKLKDSELMIYLETNGTMPDRMAEIIDLLDIISMDIKLPSMTGMADRLEEHIKVLRVAKAKEVFVKVVFGRESKSVEIDSASKAIAEVGKGIPLVLQPVSPTKTVKHGPMPDQILLFHSIAMRHLDNVRVIPQAHKLFGQL